MRYHEINEAMHVGNTRIYEIRTKAQLAGALRRHNNYLRGFVDLDDNILFAWDAETEVHPDVRHATGVFGLPVQVSSTTVHLRPHGLPLEYIKQMYRELVTSPFVQRLYGGKPRVYLDDEYTPGYDRLDTLGWEDEPDETDDHWTDNWVSY